MDTLNTSDMSFVNSCKSEQEKRILLNNIPYKEMM